MFKFCYWTAQQSHTKQVAKTLIVFLKKSFKGLEGLTEQIKELDRSITIAADRST